VFDKNTWQRASYASDIERHRAYAKKHYYKHREEILDRAGKSRLRKLWGKEYHYLAKTKVLMHYSNPPGKPICNNCGEQDAEVLCIDHIKGGGLKQRREINYDFYLWLVKNDYPEGYQTFCANCNTKKAKLEY